VATWLIGHPEGHVRNYDDQLTADQFHAYGGKEFGIAAVG